MSRPQTLCIGEFCKTGSGSTPSRSEFSKYYEGGTIPWVKSGELREGLILDTEEHVTSAALAETSVKLVPKGAILLAMYGATVGRLALLGIEATTNQAVCHIVPDPGVADTRYLFHALSNQVPSIVAMGVGGAQPNISQGVVKNLKIWLPPLPEQLRIAAILDKADALRTKRREALAQVDQLAQSIFLEMFGDPISNPKGLKKQPLSNIVKVKSGDFLPASEMASDGRYPVFGGNGVNGYHDTFMFDRRQIVIGRVGVYCGCVHTTPAKCWVTDNALFVSEHSSDVDFDFLAYSLKLANLNQYASQSAQPLISGARIYPVEILVPPKEQQMEFIARTCATNVIGDRFKGSSNELDALFASLQRRAFSGAL